MNHSEHEFTLDFVRLDFSTKPANRGILVARVAISPSLVLELIDALQAEWQEYAKKALPREVYDDERGAEEDDQGGP